MFGLGSTWHWLIVVILVVLVFGTGKLRHAGRDLGGAIAGFRKAMKGPDSEDTAAAPPSRTPER